MLKIGLDLHGVIDEDPDFFCLLTHRLLINNHKVYIITGREANKSLYDEIKQCGVYYSEILSITTYQKRLGTLISYLDDQKTQPIMHPDIWNPTKAALCATAVIDFMIDDSEIYEKFFNDIKTQYIRYTSKTKEFLKVLFY